MRIGGVVRIGVACLLVAWGAAWLGRSPTTNTAAKVDCGSSSLVLFVSPSSTTAPSWYEDECQEAAKSAVWGAALVAFVPAALVLMWPRIRARDVARRAARQAVAPRSYASEVAVAARVRSSGSGPVAVRFDSPLTTEDALMRLTVPSDGAPDSLEVLRGPDGTVSAAFSTKPSPTLVAQAVPTDGGMRLDGYVRPAPGQTGALVTLLGIAVAATVLAVLAWISASTENGFRGFAVLAFIAVVAGRLALFGRIRGNWITACGGDRLCRAIGAALQCAHPPVIRPQPIAARTRRQFGPILVAVGLGLYVLLLISFLHAPHPLRGIVYVLTIEIVVLLGTFVVRRWWPKLDGAALTVGGRRVDLDQVRDVRANKGILSLADDRSRVVVPSLFGMALTAADVDEAPFSIYAGPAPATRDVVVAIDRVVRRCPLDPLTAAALYRSPTPGEVTRRAPAILPIVLARLGVLIAALVAVRVALSFVD